MENDTTMECQYPRCGCLGYGYVPVQDLSCTYELECAIENGTLFPELDLKINEYGTICKKWGGTQND